MVENTRERVNEGLIDGKSETLTSPLQEWLVVEAAKAVGMTDTVKLLEGESEGPTALKTASAEGSLLMLKLEDEHADTPAVFEALCDGTEEVLNRGDIDRCDVGEDDPL